MEFITPLLILYDNFGNNPSLVEEKIRKFFIAHFNSIDTAAAIKLRSPLQELLVAIDLFKDSCKILNDYRDVLIDVDPDIRLTACVRAFSDKKGNDFVVNRYEAFLQKWNSAKNLLGDNWTENINFSEYSTGRYNILKKWASS